jgi:hypothetical protein
MTQSLSPAAQAVLDAYGNQIGGIDAIMGSERRGLAAALRAAAVNGGIKTRGGGVILDCRFILAIAAELEGQ